MNYKISYNEYRQCGSLRSMLNRTHNSKFITPELQAYLDYRLDDESKFHESGWKHAVVVALYDFIVGCKLKRLRLEKVLKMLDILTSYKNDDIELALEDYAKDKGYGEWETRVMAFPATPVYPCLTIELGDNYGYITKATKATKSSRLIDFEVSEWIDGEPTGKTVLVTYDMGSHQRYHHGYKKPYEEAFKGYYEEDEENGIL